MGPGRHLAEVGEEVTADGGVAGLGGGDVGADFPVGFTEWVCAEEVQDFGIGEDGGLRVEDLWIGEGQWARVGR